MQIISLPANYASLRDQLIYTFAQTSVQMFDIKVIDPDTNKLLGTRRFVGQSQVSIDIAPMLRRIPLYAPQTGSTGFVTPTGRSVSVVVEIDGIRTERRTFLPTLHTITTPKLISSQVGVRRIAGNECDELTIYTSTPAKLTLTTIYKGVHTPKIYTAPTAGLILFRLNTADFPQAEVIQIAITGIGTTTYSIHNRIVGTRLAWRSSTGSIEHYSFPVISEQHEQVQKSLLHTENLVIPTHIRSQSVLTLRSDYEPERTILAITELLNAPAVWRIVKGEYQPVEVVNTASGVRSQGSLQRLEVQIQHQPKNILP